MWNAEAEETFAENQISRQWKRTKTYIACEDLDFAWDEWEVKDVIEMWKVGVPIDYIAKNFDRPQEEVVVLLIDLALRGYVKSRKGGVLGG